MAKWLLYHKNRIWLRCLKKAYTFYYGCKIGGEDKSWAPHICCNTWATNLKKWLSCERPFADLMFCRKPTDHISNSCFRMIPQFGKVFSKKKVRLKYLNTPSAIRSVPHGNGLPVPEDNSTIKKRNVVTLNHQLHATHNFFYIYVYKNHI